MADHDVGWGRTSYRQRIATALDHFIAVADGYRQMPALRDVVGDLEQLLRRTWPTTDQQLATYPALV